MEIPVIFLMGPTASGKTAAACAVAERFPVEIISVDAAQVYRGMDIGTAKMSVEERRRYPHQLVDIRDPDETYSAALFQKDALGLIDAARERGRIPLLVGGTMFYFHTLLHGLPPLPAADEKLRARIEARAAAQGWPALHAELAAMDPRRAAEIAPGDRQRIQRALEVNILSGSAVARPADVRAEPPWPLVRVALAPARREELHRRIEQRFHAMVRQGLVEEVAALLKIYGGPPEPPAFGMVGYRQVAEYLKDRVGYNRMMEASIAATRRLAKRQLTWLRRQRAITWLDSASAGSARSLLAYLESHPRISGTGRRGAA